MDAHENDDPRLGDEVPGDAGSTAGDDSTAGDVEVDDPVLEAAGARLRQRSRLLSGRDIELGVLRRRARRFGALAGAGLAAAVLLAGLLVAGVGSRGRGPAVSTSTAADRVIASLGRQPVDPTRVKLVSSVSTFPDCSALVDDLRRVGAAHVGSRGFGAYDGQPTFSATTAGASFSKQSAFAAPTSAGGMVNGVVGGVMGGPTLGTNVQVAGVDELDFVKAEGNLVYDLDAKGRLRITDASSLQVLSTLDVAPPAPAGGLPTFGPSAAPSRLLVSKGHVVVFGTVSHTSEPVAGDPSATRVTTTGMFVTFVDASDPASPRVTDRVQVEGSLVSARLVGDEVRLVTTSNMADLGFVMPTTPNSVPKALDENRRSVASSNASDWIPDWQRDGGQPQPLVPCDRVHVPDTFAGVAMTSMVSFPLGAGRFEPAATSILAPGTTVYAGLDKVAVSSEVWVDPIDRDRLKFDDWRTAVHEFTFGAGAPTYTGSGIVDGSTVGQFAFGEIGGSLGVVSAKGTPWQQQTAAGVDLTVLTPDGHGHLSESAKVPDLSGGSGAVSAVRFVDGRVLVSTGPLGQSLRVVDVTDPARPRQAGSLDVGGDVGYFHPLPAHRALLVGSRVDTVGTGNDRRTRSWVRAQLLDVGNADAPRIVATWERPWSSDMVGADHHAFTFWPDRSLAMWGIEDGQGGPNHAIVLGTDGSVTEVAAPVANEPPETAPPCPVVDQMSSEARSMLGPNGVALRCGDKSTTEVDWARYSCYRVDDSIVAQYAPDSASAAYFVCNPAPRPTVARVLVVSGRPLLLTDQTLEALDPTTFQSVAVAYHPTSPGVRFAG